MRAKLKVGLCAYILLLHIAPNIFSQGLNINIQSVNSLTASDSINLVYDVNGDICNLVIVRTELDSLKFYSNRGTEKISKTEIGYDIWIPTGSTILKISAPGTPICELNIPKSQFTNSVYTIILESKIEKRIVYENPALPILSVSTEPANTKFYIYDVFIGRTPLVIYVNDNQVINYKIKSARYLTAIGSDTMKLTRNNINLKLKDASRSKMFFLIATASAGPIKYYQEHGQLCGIMGISLGSIGGTGLYSSLKSRSKKALEGGLYETKNFEVQAGITQQLCKPVFFKTGAGYTKRVFEPITYNIIGENGMITANKATATSSHGFNIDMGLIFRIAWNSVFLVNCTMDYAKPFDTSGRKTIFEFGIGLGFNLPLEMDHIR